MGHSATDTPSTRLSDVAAAAGVSIATASRVMSGSERVRPELRDRVVAAARELAYVPNAHAQALARANTSMVGLIVHDISDPYFSEIARGAMRVASGSDRMALVSNSHREPERELTYVQALRSQRVSAIVLAGSGFRDPEHARRATAELRAFEAGGGRVALVGRHDLPVDTVLPANRQGATAAMDHLIALGHARIGIISGPEALTTVEDRLAGVQAALAEAPECATWTVSGDFTRDGGYEAAQRLLTEHPDLTALFALNDSMAIGALAALRDLGLAVPDDVSVVGFDDIPMAVDLTPPLTTVRLRMADMGALAMELAMREPATRPRRRRMDAELVVRETSAQPST